MEDRATSSARRIPCRSTISRGQNISTFAAIREEFTANVGGISTVAHASLMSGATRSPTKSWRPTRLVYLAQAIRKNWIARPKAEQCDEISPSVGRSRRPQQAAQVHLRWKNILRVCGRYAGVRADCEWCSPRGAI